MFRFSPQFSLVSALTFSLVSCSHAQTFDFALPWNDDAKTSISAADLNPAPLTDAQRVRVKDGHFFDGTGRRVRFVGANFVASANFTRPEDAPAVAARLHKFGFNIVRLHHIDASWSNPSIYGADRDAQAGPNQIVDAQSLALLDNLASELGKHGVYLDLNLHVARALTGGDGFPDSDKLPEMGKVVAYFDPQFIAQQKDYARQILNHVNPKTGLKWANDPALALVELNNEDTLIGHAFDGSLQALPAHYRDTLMNGWNTFLRARYAGDDALRRAWQGEPLGDNIARAVVAGAATAPWDLSLQGGSQARVETVAGENGDQALKINIEQKPAQDWQLELMQTHLKLRAGQNYTVSLRARAEAPRTIGASVGINRAPWTRYGAATFALSPQWKPFHFTFRAGDLEPDLNRITFALGADSNAVYLSDVQIRPGLVADISPNWSLDKANYDLPGQSLVPAQAQDWIDYLAAIEKSYVDTMTDCIKKEIGYQGLVCCSQASYGAWAGVARESRTDWIDMHAYWQHPNFPGQSWDASNWNIGNSPMADDANTGTLLNLAAHRVAGQPFTVSEYNHAAPNDYASETIPMIFGFAAAQDWDGVFLFDYNGDHNNWNVDKIRNFFSVDSDLNKMAFLPSMARAFIRGDITALAATTTLVVPRDKLLEMSAQTRSDSVYNSLVTDEWRARGLTRDDLMRSRVQLQLAPSGEQPKLERKGTRGGAWKWDFVGGRGVVTLDAPAIKTIVGTIGDRFLVGPLQLGALRVSDVQSSNQWAALTLVALDKLPVNQSKSLLLTAMNRAENRDMNWNAERTSVGDKWGDGPMQIEVPRAQIKIQTSAKSARVFRLTATGARGKIQDSQLKNGVLSFEIGPQDQTVWWEIAAE